MFNNKFAGYLEGRESNGKEKVRQGDVIIRTLGKYEEDHGVKAVIGGEIEKEDTRVVLAHGEATGHLHAIEQPNVRLFEIQNPANDLVIGLIDVSEDAQVVHQEHEQIGLPPGKYVASLPREYDESLTRRGSLRDWSTVID